MSKHFRSLVYVADGMANDGSGVVYRSASRALRTRFDVRMLMFGPVDPGVDALVLPGPAPSKTMKVLRTLSRYANGCLLGPAPLEEFGRGPIKQRVWDFIADADILLVNKFNAVRWLGSDVVRNFRGLKVVDMHDDFVVREDREREVLANLMHEYPRLNEYDPYRLIFHKHRLSRLDVAAARRQEAAYLSMFDQILVASKKEADRYAESFPGRVSWCPWPVATTPTPRSEHFVYDIGFIASDAIFNLEGVLAFVKYQLPLIRALNPNFSFTIAGGVCKPFALACPGYAQQGITLMGRVESVAEFYDAVGTVVVPLVSGTGVSLKALEPIQHGCPVLSTPVGVRGIHPSMLPASVKVIDFWQFSNHLPMEVAVHEAVPSSLDDIYLESFERALIAAEALRQGSPVATMALREA